MHLWEPLHKNGYSFCSYCFYIHVFYKNEIRMLSTGQDLPTQMFYLCLKVEELIRTLSLGWYVTILSTAAFWKVLQLRKTQ